MEELLQKLVDEYKQTRSATVRIVVGDETKDQLNLISLKKEGYISNYAYKVLDDDCWECVLTSKAIGGVPGSSAKAQEASNDTKDKIKKFCEDYGFGEGKTLPKKWWQLSLYSGIALIAIICAISYAFFGKIYFLNGYDITKGLWLFAIAAVVFGLFGLLHKPNLALLSTTIILLLCIFLLFGSIADSLGWSKKEDTKGQCANCSGSGMVIVGFAGHETCPVCHGSGIDPYSGFEKYK